MRRCLYRISVAVFHILDRKRRRLMIVCHKLDRIAKAESVSLRQHGIAVCIAFLDNGAHLCIGVLACLRIVLAGISVIKSGAVRAVAELIYLITPYLRQRFAVKRTVYRMAIRVGNGSGVVG